MHYVTEHAAEANHAPPTTRPNRVWFANVVAATEYIGPLAAGTRSARVNSGENPVGE
jgi:hypothetical protein